MDNVQSLQYIFPELILALFSFIVLIGGVFSRGKTFPAGVVAFLGVAVSALFLHKSFGGQHSLFFGLLVNDGFSVFFREIILLITGLITLLSMGYRGVDREDEGEYYFFLLVVSVSMMLAAASNNLLMVYLTVESILFVPVY